MIKFTTITLPAQCKNALLSRVGFIRRSNSRQSRHIQSQVLCRLLPVSIYVISVFRSLRFTRGVVLINFVDYVLDHSSLRLLFSIIVLLGENIFPQNCIHSHRRL